MWKSKLLYRNLLELIPKHEDLMRLCIKSVTWNGHYNARLPCASGVYQVLMICLFHFSALNILVKFGFRLSIFSCRSFGSYWRPELYRIDGLNSLHYKLDTVDEQRWHTRLKVWLQPIDQNSAVVQQFENVAQTTIKITPRSCKLTGFSQFTSLQATEQPAAAWNEKLRAVISAFFGDSNE